MIIGMSMGLETSLILGQVSLNLFYWKKTSRRTYVEKTACIQARSFIARTLGQHGKECQAEGEAKVVA